MNNDVSRRALLGGVVGVAARARLGAGEKLPTRVLGRTGLDVPIISIGCGGSWWAKSKTEDRALEALNLAIDLGINYLDTGQGYGEGKSETWIGKVLKQRRREALIATKISVRDGDEAMRETERCLKRLQTNQLDVLHIHNLGGVDDLRRIEKRGGLIDVLYRLRDEKVARFIGITSHTDPEVLKTALERHEFDCTQMALNAALQGFAGDEPSMPPGSFESVALPAARKKNIGVLAMKSTGRSTLTGRPPEKSDFDTLVRYVLSLPVSTAVVGMHGIDYTRHNAELARNFQPMPKAEREKLSAKMSVANKVALGRYFRHHRDS